MTDCAVLRIDKKAMMEALHREHEFSDLFVAYLLARNIRYPFVLQGDLISSWSFCGSSHLPGFPRKTVTGISERRSQNVVGHEPYHTARRCHCSGHGQSVEFRRHQEQPVRSRRCSPTEGHGFDLHGGRHISKPRPLRNL